MTDTAPATILIIEDVEASRAELIRMVEALGHRAVGAGGGLEGLRMLREHQPSLVLLDVVMPQFDGFKIAAMIKAQPRFVPVMLLTGLDDLESKRRGQAAGADDFLSKPVRAMELQIRISAMLRIKALTDALDVANQRLVELSETDPLTGLKNRRRFDSLLEYEAARTVRYGRPISLLMMDIDHFKRVNDTYGHPAGDAVIKEVARILAVGVRKQDHVGRLGGEEFAVIAPETGLTGALVLAERLRASVEEAQIQTDAGLLQATISIGVRVFESAAPVTGPLLVKNADEALYASKQSGRNRCTLYRGDPAPSDYARAI